MKKLVLINSVCGIRSTGRICTDIALNYESKGYVVKIAYGRENVPNEYKKYSIKIGNKLDNYISVLETRLFDNHGFSNRLATKRFLKWLDEYNPDILWLHNIHGYYINVELLFNWIKSKPNLEVKWTLHDCWAFTGHCSHFSHVGCYKWKDGCTKCPQKTSYPKCVLFSNAKDNYERKKKAFTEVSNLELIVPSEWLKNLVKQSFLKKYPVSVVPNTIDEDIFYKRDKNVLREKYHLENKIILLGVASVWSQNKGLDRFIELSKILEDKYQIVLVGLNSKQKKSVPNNIICIDRTNNLDELVNIYSSCDIFLNLSTEETFGMTTVEAIYCGCKAIVLKDTACEEIAREYGGFVVNNDINDIYKAIKCLNSNV